MSIQLETISAEKLVNSAQILIPFYPLPTHDKIDEILSQLCKAFQIPFTTESNAKELWRKRITPSYQRAPRAYISSEQAP